VGLLVTYEKKNCWIFPFSLFINFCKFFAAPIIRPCPRNHQNLSSCIIDEVERLRPNIANGNFGEGFDIPSLDPWYVTEFPINIFDWNIKFSNIIVVGGSQFEIQNMK
jgi:hypothetical protein